MGIIKKIIKNTYFRFLIIAFLISIVLIIILSKKAMPIIINYASVESKKISIEVLRNTGIKEVNKYLDDKELFDIVKNNNNEIESIDINAKVINETMSIISKNVVKSLNKIENENSNNYFFKNKENKMIYEVPFGIVFNNAFLSNIGPKIPVEIKYVGNVGLDVKTRVKAYGMNSALIEVFVYVEVTQRSILPFLSKDVKLKSEVPIVIKVVKGSTPYYLNGNYGSYDLPIN